MMTDEELTKVCEMADGSYIVVMGDEHRARVHCLVDEIRRLRAECGAWMARAQAAEAALKGPKETGGIHWAA